MANVNSLSPRLDTKILLAITRRLLDAPASLENLTTVRTPPLSRATVFRYLDGLRTGYRLKIEFTNRGYVVQDWGVFREDRLRSA